MEKEINFVRSWNAHLNERQLVGVIVAMDRELEMIEQSDAFEFVGEMGTGYFNVLMYAYKYTTPAGETVDIVVAKSGIGKVNAAVATTELINRCIPDYVISTGVCGTLSRQIVVQNDVYMPQFVTYYDVYCGSPNHIGQVQDYPDRYETLFSSEELIEKVINDVDIPEHKFYTGYSYPIISGDMFVEDKDIANHIESFGYPLSDFCDCGIDMESTAIAQVCYRANVPFGTVRIVSDAPQRAEWLKSCRYEDFWDKAPDTLHRILRSVIDHATYIRNYQSQSSFNIPGDGQQ